MSSIAHIGPYDDDIPNSTPRNELKAYASNFNTVARQMDNILLQHPQLPRYAAAAIAFFRSDSQWTERKEDWLIAIGKNHTLCGCFNWKVVYQNESVVDEISRITRAMP